MADGSAESLVIPDDVVDRIVIRAGSDEDLVTIHLPEGSPREWWTITDVNMWFTPNPHRLGESVWSRSWFRQYQGGFAYPDSPPNLVEVQDLGVRVATSIPAFERYMARFFNVLITAALERRHQIHRHPRWPDFVQYVESIERRLACGG